MPSIAGALASLHADLTTSGAGIADAIVLGMPGPSSPATTAFDSGQPTHGGYRDISPRTASAARGTVRLIDVREPHEFTGELGHIAGSELVPLATVIAAAHTWDRNAELILVCRSGVRSARAAEALVSHGFRRVMNLAGGMLAYHAARLPVERTEQS
jgi:sulfur-carrier protein adenylyltransferase/sulfurtransferase